MASSPSAAMLPGTVSSDCSRLLAVTIRESTVVSVVALWASAGVARSAPAATPSNRFCKRYDMLNHPLFRPSGFPVPGALTIMVCTQSVCPKGKCETAARHGRPSRCHFAPGFLPLTGHLG